MNELPIQNILIAALGGQGGGVLVDWLVQCARDAGLAVQATSVPGVAQRTGATSYYIEWSRAPVADGQPRPVFALSPVPARVDVAIASEALEAARLIERGFVTPERTCLVASTSRIYTTAEKMHMDDGRFDPERIQVLARTLARRAVLMDMDALTQHHRTVVSAVMFGALCGAGVLPWPVPVCEAAIRASGKGVEASLAGFHAARAQASGSAAPHAPAPAPKAARLESIVDLGAARCLDYQDAAYATRYREQVDAAVRSCAQAGVDPQRWAEAARHLALWMCYEDIVRVADLKTRPQRLQRLRAEAGARADDLVHVTEHFKPGVHEIASILPAGLGRRLLAWAGRSGKDTLHVGLHIRSTSLWGYLLLRFLARLRPLRRSSLRFQQEHTAMAAWWDALQHPSPASTAWLEALAGLPQVRKGYGDTQLRGLQSYDHIWQTCVQPVLEGRGDPDAAAQALRNAIAHALEAPAEPSVRPPREQGIRWFPKVPG